MFDAIQHVPSLISGVVNRTGLATDRNQTATAFGPSDMLPGLLESFIPGYGIFRRIILELSGFDVSVFVPLIAILLALHAGGVYAFGYIRDSVEQYCTCAVDMNEWDEPYQALMRWLNEKNHFRKVRYLRIAGRWWQRITEQSEHAFALSGTPEHRDEKTAQGSTPIFNPEAKPPTGFEPDEGRYYFWHRGRPFCLDLYFKEMKHRETNVHKIRLSCFGMSTQPLKDLIKEALALEVETKHMTDFFRPYPNDSEWKCINSRPARPLDTVTLDAEQKARIMHDVNDFIHPARKRWYASRGIPYRRGYLFSGPPGTGKTSLSLALAGVFNLSLYAVSIQDPTMSDTRLTELFDDLPSQCIILLEDIDSAGVGGDRAASADDNNDDVLSSTSASADQRPQNKPKSSRVTLAGLLNAIDGVASHEGHGLIMTTNHPEKLDAALKRPGRVDLHVEFTLATRFQAREIFLRMFTDEKPLNEVSLSQDGTSSTTKDPAKNATGLSQKSRKAIWLSSRPATVEEACRDRSELANPEHQVCPFMPFSELHALADVFVAALPEMMFSPAEVQGYLLVNKANPWAAANGAAVWAEGMMAAKRLKEAERSENQVKAERESESKVVDVTASNREEKGEEETKALTETHAQDQRKRGGGRRRRRRMNRQRAMEADNGTLTPGPSDEDKGGAEDDDDVVSCSSGASAVLATAQ